MNTPVLALRGATKKYGGVVAIDGIDFELNKGEIHAILGENGAGKSTLTKVMAGVVPLTSGQIFLDGKEVKPATPNEAHQLGIAMVFQENSLVPTMSVAQNLLLGNERLLQSNARHQHRSPAIPAIPAVRRRTRHPIVSQLGAAKKQMVEIARAVLNNAKSHHLRRSQPQR